MSLLRVVLLGVLASASIAPLAAQSGSRGVLVPPAAPQTGLDGRDLSALMAAQTAVNRQAVITLMRDGRQDSGRCFAMRSSQFAAEPGAPDVVKRVGNSTCQASRSVRLKTVETPGVR